MCERSKTRQSRREKRYLPKCKKRKTAYKCIVCSKAICLDGIKKTWNVQEFVDPGFGGCEFILECGWVDCAFA